VCLKHFQPDHGGIAKVRIGKAHGGQPFHQIGDRLAQGNARQVIGGKAFEQRKIDAV